MNHRDFVEARNLLYEMDEAETYSFLEFVLAHIDNFQRVKAKKEGKVLLQVSKGGEYVTVAEQDYIKGEEV